MGFLDGLTGKKEATKGSPEGKKEQTPDEVPEGKYEEECSLCGAPGSEKKWMGQYWHKACLRKMKKGAKKMI